MQKMNNSSNSFHVIFESDSENEPISTLVKIVLSIMAILYEIFVNPLLLGSFLFEKYGVDSQRRTVTNMLFSKASIALIFNNILATPLSFYGLVLVPKGLNYWIGAWALLVPIIAYTFSSFCMFQLLLCKLLYATNWSNMAHAGTLLLLRYVP